MAEIDEGLLEDITKVIFASKWFFSNNKEHAKILANQILTKATPILVKRERERIIKYLKDNYPQSRLVNRILNALKEE